jgi:uncharacterized OsmC-like protein
MHVDIDWTGNISFTASCRTFAGLTIDEPMDFHGDDTGPSPAEYLAVGIGSCLGVSLAYACQKMAVKIERLSVGVDLTFEDVEDEGESLERVTGAAAEIEIQLVNPEDGELLDLCLQSFEKHCVVTQSVMLGIPVTVNVKKLE